LLSKRQCNLQHGPISSVTAECKLKFTMQWSTLNPKLRDINVLHYASSGAFHSLVFPKTRQAPLLNQEKQPQSGQLKIKQSTS
jgi:hypothetical protein